MSYLIQIRDFVEHIGKKYKYSEKMINSFKLVIDEACTNIIRHGYRDIKNGEIQIKAIVRRLSLTIVIVDQVLGQHEGHFDGNPLPRVMAARNEVLAQHLAQPLEDYLVQLVTATRDPVRYGDELAGVVQYGASPRATMALDRAARVGGVSIPTQRFVNTARNLDSYYRQVMGQNWK